MVAASATRARRSRQAGRPAGLTAGYLLAKAGKPVVVVEAEHQVGGIAKTVVDEEGYRFDLGGHRFFTKVQEVDDLWHEVMGEEFLRRPRQSRIYYDGKFLEYPLEGMDVVKKLGPVELSRAGLSYMAAKFKRKGSEDSLEELKARRAEAQSGTIDVDETELNESLELPGADLSNMSGEELTVGRAGGCAISLPDDTYVSSLHARVFTSGGRVLVEDLGSTNGTYLNGTKLTSTVPLGRGDRLQVGSTVLEAR